jgi:hypothetical protein
VFTLRRTKLAKFRSDPSDVDARVRRLNTVRHRSRSSRTTTAIRRPSHRNAGRRRLSARRIHKPPRVVLRHRRRARVIHLHHVSQTSINIIITRHDDILLEFLLIARPETIVGITKRCAPSQPIVVGVGHRRSASTTGARQLRSFFKNHTR